MKLDEFITESIATVMKAMQDTNARLQKDNLGSVWLEDTRTITSDLAPLGIIKIGDEKGQPSRPAFVFQFDVNVVAEEKTDAEVQASGKLGGKALQLFTAEAEVTGGINGSKTGKNAQNLKFSIIAAPPKEEEQY
jgi:hypothetical protein